jgi:hypothetical protein
MSYLTGVKLSAIGSTSALDNTQNTAVAETRNEHMQEVTWTLNSFSFSEHRY